MPSFVRWTITLTLVSAAVLGCAASSDFMREDAARAPIHASAEAATVVFIRHQTALMKFRGFAVIDEKGRYLGESLAGSHFSTQVPPGHHQFIAWGDGTHVLEADLVPGKVYYVEVRIGNGAELFALTPQSGEWKELKGWLDDTTGFKTDEAAGQSYITTKKRDQLAARLAEAPRVLGAYSAEDRARRTLRPADGQ